jgi:hypothetical protein
MPTAAAAHSPALRRKGYRAARRLHAEPDAVALRRNAESAAIARLGLAWLGLPSECTQVMAMRPGSALPVELRTVFKGCALLADADDKTSKPPPLMDLVRRECGSPGDSSSVLRVLTS